MVYVCNMQCHFVLCRNLNNLLARALASRTIAHRKAFYDKITINMKYKHIIFPAIVFAVISLVACQNKEGLSKKASGTWQSVPEHIVNTDSFSVDLIKSYEFAPLEDANGTLVVSAMLSIEKYMPESDSIISPLTINAAAVASVTGTYEAISYDKIILKPDASTFNLSVDTAAVSYDYDVLDNNAAPSLMNLKSEWVKQFQAYLTPIVKANLMCNDTLTEIKITDTLMHCKDGDTDLTLRLQTPQ